jgi:multisubunit Na+/H+ antiporter MnhB subunit
MRILLKIVAVLFVAIGAFLIYAVVHAMGSAGGAKVGIAILYVVIALVLAYAASWLWRRSSRARSSAA